MLKTKFYLKDAKKSSSLVICAIFLQSQKLLSISTGIKIPPKEWNKNKQEFKNLSPICDDAKQVLSNLKQKIFKLSLKIDNIDSHEEIKAFLQNELNRKHPNKQIDFYECFEVFFNEKTKITAVNTMKAYKCLINKLRLIEKEVKTTLFFDYWNIETLDRFKSFLLGIGYLNDTINNQLKCMKVFLNWTYARYHENKAFKGYRIKWENHNVISLTSKELQKIYEHDFSKNYILTEQEIFSALVVILLNGGQI